MQNTKLEVDSQQLTSPYWKDVKQCGPELSSTPVTGLSPQQTCKKSTTLQSIPSTSKTFIILEQAKLKMSKPNTMIPHCKSLPSKELTKPCGMDSSLEFRLSSHAMQPYSIQIPFFYRVRVEFSGRRWTETNISLATAIRQSQILGSHKLGKNTALLSSRKATQGTSLCEVCDDERDTSSRDTKQEMRGRTTCALASEIQDKPKKECPSPL